MDYTYDYLLVSLSFAVAVFASFVALGLTGKIYSLTGGAHRLRWLAGSSAVMGVGIWSMHFIGMLAFHLPIQLTYDPFMTFISILVAILASGSALSFAVTFKARYKILISSLLMGAGIAGMHYTGMAAVQVNPPIQYTLWIVILSILIAVSASYFAFYISHKTFDEIPLLFEKKNIFGSLILGFAIAGMHYTAMEAAVFAPDSICSVEGFGFNSRILALATAVFSLIVIGITILLLTFDVKFAKQNAFMIKKLKEHNENLEKEANVLAESMVQQIKENARKDRVLAAIVEQADLAIVTVDTERVIQSWNRSAEKIFKYSEKDVLGKHFDIILQKADEDKCDSIYDKESKNVNITSYKTMDDNIVYVTLYSSPLYDDDSLMIGTILMMRDAAALHEANKQMALWSSVYKYSSEGIIITDSQNRIISINKSFSAITGYSFSDVHLKNPRVLSSGMMDEDFYADMWNQILEKGYWKGEILNKRKNGEVYPEWLSIATLRNREGQICNFIAIFSDATEYRKREDAIRHMAYHDNLTDLPNRALMEDRIKMEIAHSTRMNNHFAILFLDLDRFKNLNDTFGHTLGDRLLIEVGKRLKGAVRNDDTVSRLGGDEFIIMLRDMTKPQTAAKIAKKILLSISDDFKIENEIFKITPSIGIALYPQDGTDSDELLRNADAAMYHAKDQGRGNYQFFTPELNDLIEERKMIEKALESAVENSEFQLYYQPQISISEKKVVGAEALIRWFHPQMGKVNPSKFISIAEDTGLIHKIGEWVIMEALSQFEKWSSVIPDFEKMTFSINLSVLQLEKENFYNLFKDQISKVSFPHEILEIEITETSLMRNANQISEMLKKLKELNITITIDDFGSGFTSLNHLKKLPVDRIKIDRSFVSDIAEDSNAVYTEAIVRLAQTLDLSIVAEGGENQEQEDMLLKAGCDVVQGFYYSKALSSEDFLLFLNHYNQ